MISPDDTTSWDVPAAGRTARMTGWYQLASAGRLAIHASVNWNHTMYAQMTRNARSRFSRLLRTFNETTCATGDRTAAQRSQGEIRDSYDGMEP